MKKEKKVVEMSEDEKMQGRLHRFTITGNLVNLFTDEIYPAEVEIENGTIMSISRIEKGVKGFIVPGLIDAHIHIESSMLTPSNFAAASVPHGTTGVVADAHEIVNIAGMQGFKYMLEDAKGVPLKFFFTAPSCVPSTPMDTGGAVIGVPEIREMFGLGAVALGEVMNFPGVISGEEGLMQKIAAARESEKPVDGHAPGLTDRALDTYISAGISTDHECLSFEEAWEKAEKGMIPMIREGSAAQGLEMLSGLIGRTHTFLCTDDLHSGDLLKGHIDSMVRRLLAMGKDVFDVLRAASLLPALHYRLNTGIIAPGMSADFLMVDDLSDFNVRAVYINGKKAAEDGRALFSVHPRVFQTKIVSPVLTPDSLILHPPAGFSGNSLSLRTIEVRDRALYTAEKKLKVQVENGRIVLNGNEGENEDAAFVAVVSRYGTGKVGNGILTGTGIKRGAIAMSIAHDAHNFIVLGRDENEMHRSLSLISKTGGIAVVDGRTEQRLELPIAGLMATESAETVAGGLERLHRFTENMEITLKSPFITLSFIALPVIPALKLTPEGYFDVLRGRVVSAFPEPEDNEASHR